MVDAEALRAFVRVAASTYREALLSDDDSQLPHAQNAFKGKNSIDLEDVNGYKIVRGPIDAAEAGGGFVE